MNNNQDKDEARFNKLYELLGDEVNSIYETKSDDEIFTNANNNQQISNEVNSNTLEANNITHTILGVMPTNIINQNNIVNDNNTSNNTLIDNTQSVVSTNAINHNNIESITSVNISNQNNTQSVVSNNTTNRDNNQPNNNVYLNKTTVEGQNIYDDVDNIDTGKRTIKEILSNHKTVSVIMVLAFIFVCIVVGKAFYFGKKIDKYEEFFTEITYKEEEMAKVYEDNEIDSEVLKKMAASELVNCISSPIDMNNLPDSINNIITEINNYYNRSYNYFSFAYKDIFTGFTVSYNANQDIFTASAIKGPTDIYIYEMASQGKVDLDEVVTYTSNYYNTGSGVLKNKPINSQYSIRTLLEYSTVTSDNAAHNMLMDKYGRENMLNFWSNLGTNAIFTANNNWGVMNAHDALIYMSELYRFYAQDDVYGEAIMNNFIKAYPTFLKGKSDVLVANKSGWSGTAIHDVAIIFADNPYIVVALSNTGESDYVSYFNNANELAYRLHEAYWKYKMDTCNNIKQY